MPPRRCNPTRRAAAAVAQQRGRRRRFPGRLRRSSGGGNGVRRRRTRIAAVTAPTAIDAPAIRILASDPSRSPGRARRMGPCGTRRRAPSPRRTQVPRRQQRRRRSEDPWRGPRASTAAAGIATKPRRSSKAMDLLSLARRMTSPRAACVPRFVRAKAGEHGPREHRRRRDPAAPSSPAPRHRRVALRLTRRAVPAARYASPRPLSIALPYSPRRCARSHA